MSRIICGFEPFFQITSRVLVLGSFPSVKSRDIGFYYGNPQNRFWKVLSEYFGESAGTSVNEKKDFLQKHGVALWDVVYECEIQGSSDASIRKYIRADVEKVIKESAVELVLLNGVTAKKIYLEGQVENVPYLLMPSTSPANPRFDKSIWFGALDTVFAKK